MYRCIGWYHDFIPVSACPTLSILLVIREHKTQSPHPYRLNAFSTTTCTMPNPKFNVTLSDRESTILSPASIDSAHGGRSSLLKQRDAILSARIPDPNTRKTWADVCCDNENRRPCVIRAGDRGRFVSTELPRRGAK